MEHVLYEEISWFDKFLKPGAASAKK
jgi:hypothetical protein